MSGTVKINSAGGGSISLTPASTASNVTATIPAATDTLVNLASSQSLSNKTITAANSNTVEATSGPTSTQLAGQRNKIINGAMMIDQRNAGAAVTPTTTAYTVDRWYLQCTQSSKFSVQQNAGSVTPPAGFTNYVGITSLSSYAVSAGDFFNYVQGIEGYNVADLGWGAASSSSVTVSFWVRSSLTGTFSISVYNADGSRSYPSTYTISSANTWEKKTVTFTGDTTGTWGVTNGIGISICFGLGAGSSYTASPNSWQSSWKPQSTGCQSVVGTNGATFYITGVQLEKGATATPFENRLYGTELALCQRYYWRNTAGALYSAFGVGVVSALTSASGINTKLPVTMRTSPTINYSNIRITDAFAGPAVTSINGQSSTPDTWSADIGASGGGLTLGRAAVMQANGSTSAYIDASAEL